MICIYYCEINCAMQVLGYLYVLCYEISFSGMFYISENCDYWSKICNNLESQIFYIIDNFWSWGGGGDLKLLWNDFSEKYYVKIQR